ncbi:MAG: helical backbone metal receptor [Planctomycetota bacterium]
MPGALTILAPGRTVRHAGGVVVAGRIVSLVPSTTESVCQLEAGARLVGCTRYCCEPAGGLIGVTRVGGTKNPDRDIVAALYPDLVLANAEENRPEDIAWFADRFPVFVQTPRTVVEAAAALRELAERLGAFEAVQPFLLRIEARLAEAAVATLEGRPLRVFYPIWKKPWMSIGRDTFVHDVLRIVGAESVAPESGVRYPEVDLAEVLRARPQVVLLPNEPWEFTVEQRDDLRRERVFGAARLVLCDGKDFCWHGTRMADGLGRALALLQSLR